MKQKKKKICLVIPSLGPGGMERVMAELSIFFTNKRELEVHLILYGRSRKIFYPINDSIELHRPEFTFNNSFRIYYTIKTMAYLRGTIKSIDPDVILSFGEEWNNFVLLSLLGFKNKIFVADRAEPGLKRNFLHEFLIKWLYPKSEGIIVQTKIARQIYQKKFRKNKVFAIGNPIRSMSPNGEEDIKKENIILSVGRLVETKHFDLLIRLFADIDKPGWKLIIVGGDSQRQNGRQKLQSLISELGMDGRVELTGTVSNVEDYYRKSKIFAFTSSSEGFPNVIGEAMSAGLPVLAFDCVAGPSEMIDDGKSGFLIPLFNTDEFQKRLVGLMKREELRKKIGNHAIKKIDQFSIDKIGEKYYSLFKNNL